jgi:hypothetical protein
MQKYYIITNHGTRISPKFSIDHCHPSGQYIAQEAFYFPTREAAEKRLAGIIREDAAQGWTSRQVRVADGVASIVEVEPA